MMIILQYLFYILIFPGALFTIAAGLLLAGIDRKVIAHMQKRIGPPVAQPVYDFFKLIGKETIIPATANRAAYLIAPVVSFVSLCIVMLFIPILGFRAIGGAADMIVILYLITIPGAALIVGGAASGSPFAGIGISREMVTMMAYELPLVIILLTVAKKVGGDMLIFDLGIVSAYQAQAGSLITEWSMIPAAVAMLLVIPAEIGTQPFDVAEAENEICEGPLVEYSGSPLALFKLSINMKMIIMTGLFTALFFGGIRTGFVITDLIVFVLISIAVMLVCITTTHAITARLKIEHLFKFYWTVVAGLALVSAVLVWIGL